MSLITNFVLCGVLKATQMKALVDKRLMPHAFGRALLFLYLKCSCNKDCMSEVFSGISTLAQVLTSI